MSAQHGNGEVQLKWLGRSVPDTSEKLAMLDLAGIDRDPGEVGETLRRSLAVWRQDEGN